MSRGWESKDVEAQMEQREADKRAAAAAKVTLEVADTARKRGALELDRTRLQRELEATPHPRRRAQLEAGLKHLEAELAKL